MGTGKKALKITKKILKWILYILLIPTTYFLLAFLLTWMTVDREIKTGITDQSIYLNTNGVHLDVIIPQKNLSPQLLAGIQYHETAEYLSFGWGDENFYINTATWDDLTFSNAFSAMFLNSPTLMHVTRYSQVYSNWVEVKVNSTELEKLNAYIANTFKTDKNGQKIILEGKGYSSVDDFYKAKGSYSCFNTCNTWVNSAFKASGLKACVWTPFDYGLLNKYESE
ncbi:MAG: DUF2459 domain-containing protein [Saprospiraceae bacterium]|nr:DUF2459 domain-containing protein [Saprospiraceae bacterium]